MRRPAHVVGFFPPPVTGQAIATDRLAELLREGRSVTTTNLRAPAAGLAQPLHERLPHALGLRRRLAARVAQHPSATVLWASISRRPLGHLRDLFAVAPALRLAPATIAVVHWGDFDRLFRNPVTAFTARRLVRRLHGFVFLSPNLSDACAAYIPASKRFVVPNTVDDEVLCTDAEVAAKQRDRQGRHAVRLLYLSNMIPSKGYGDVLEAVRRLLEAGHAVEVDFVGGWTSEADRRQFEAEAAPLGRAVRHHGPVSGRAAIRAFHLAADAFVLPTYYPTEAQPLAIIEALGAGTPIVATHHASIPYMVRDGSEAILVPPRSPEAIASAVRSLSDRDRWRHASDRARRRFVEAFSPAAVRAHWEAVLRAVAPSS